MRALYELCGADRERVFSPYGWRVRLALGYKGLAFESRPTPFTKIPKVLEGISKTVPVLVDGATTMGDSFAICAYLEETYPQSPTLFGGPGGVANAALIDNLIVTGLYPTITRMIVLDIWSQLGPDDAAYFRTTRQARLGASLEDVQRGRDKERDTFATFLKPYTRRLTHAPFLGGDGLLFADIALAASFCWARATSPYDIMAGDPVLEAWFACVLETCKQTEALKLAT